MKQIVSIASLALWVWGCVEPRTSAPVRTQPGRMVESTESVHEGPRAPMTATWVVVKVQDTRTVLRARVERAGGYEVPLVLRVSVPPGAHLTRGASEVALPPMSQQRDVEFEYELTYAYAPADDAVLTVDGETAAMGMHARVHYRFGRAEPPVPRPTPTGPALTLGGRNFGASVPSGQ